DGGDDLWVRDDEKSPWRKLIDWNFEDAMLGGIFGFSKDGRFLYLRDSRGVNTAQLVKMDIQSGTVDVLMNDREYDLGSVLMHPDTYEIQMVSFEKEKREWKALDPPLEEDLEAIGRLQEGDFFVASRDNGLENWIIGFSTDDAPINFYFYYPLSKKGTFLFTARPDLEKYQLAEIKPVFFKARDGLTVHGYLTLPPGIKPEKLPLVIAVHGGPWSRTTWGYDPEAQWLANRGYAALDINYRGSSGYGKGFLNAGNKEWGRKMHEDLVDAVRWAVGEGIADPERIAIYGGSYGGYAALVGATFTPDLFRCAVSIVGPSNLITFIRSTPPYWKNFLANLYKRVGNPDTEEAFLKSRSPLFRVDQIKIPILIAQGANDPRVKQAESEQIVEAMKEKGIDHQYLLFKDEGHGFVKSGNRLKFYAEAEKFLSKHLGGRYEK
ncbi:MAG TPA: S9 family peptidase, partial [bacterium]|nr:S9 family peptidase [bacterium]